MSDSLQNYNNDGVRNGQGTFQVIPNYAFEGHNGESNGLDPKKIISILLRYKWLVLLFLITGVTGAWFYADSITPMYQSKGTLLISSTDALPNDELSQIISQTTGYGTSTTLVNELQILQSRKFSHQVARTLIEQNPDGIDTFPILWTEEENGATYRAGVETVASRIRDKLDFRQAEEESDVVEISFKSPSPREAAKIVNEAMEIYVDNSTLQNRRAAALTAEFLEKEKQNIKQKLQASEERLRIFMDSTGIVQVDEQASGIVTKRAETAAELQRVDLELETIGQTISNYETQLERIKPGLSDQFSEAIGPRIRNSQEELARYESERTLILAKNPGIEEREPSPSRLQYVDRQIDRLKKEIRNLSDQLFTEDDEFMGMDSEDRAEMVSGIQRRLVELRIEQNQYSSRRNALTQHKAEMEVNFNSLPEGMIELAKLQRDVRINEELYLNVSRQFADMSVWKQSQFGFGRIIDSGEIPDAYVSPNKKILLLLGVMLGGLFSAGFIVIREFSDNSVNSVDQIRTKYLPALTFSAIPSFEKVSKKTRKLFIIGKGTIPDEMVLLHDRMGLASESYRRLKNSIIYQYGDAPPQTIAVTSPEKGDGKSTLVANLGVAFADDGYKTLIIDADFRQPKIQKFLGLADKAGLTDYLAGRISAQQVIHNSDLQLLKVVTAGKKTQRPEIIVGSRAFKHFLKKMEQRFDVILLDTPPFGIISDSAALLKNADIALVVARYRKTNRGMLLRTMEELRRLQVNVTDFVLNDFDHRKETGHYYGAGYYQTLYDNYEVYVK